ncbi:RHS repeat-associated core domain-containing protein [Rhizobium etli]|uniref:RHS repeat-associated protein n=1 Tax=Rhizobium etli TaxID=29449 RepID=A0A7W6ZJG9_RHIET|nr:RHS repeat-associated core domain-containing protein [Rhizobium etli]MBB4481150.1 RHS repeat-associated protein [Rhizobium etli]MBB4537235.1 RHS repeat-associated protein [Rhizobium etli]
MGERDEDVRQRNGGQPNVAQTPANADGRVVVGAGAPEEPVDEATAFDQEIAHLEEEMNELADEPDKSAYWVAATRREMVRFLGWASQTESTVFFLGNTASPITDKISEALESDAPVATSATQYNEIREGLERIRNTAENNIADDLLNAPIPGWNQLGKLARRLAIRRARKAIQARLRRKVQERILRRRRRQRDRRDCRGAGNPAFMPTGIPVHYDPEFSLPGLIKIIVNSTYYGDVEATGPLGRGRLSDIDATIRRNDSGGFTFLDEDGFAIEFAAPTPIPDGWVDGDTVRNVQLMQGSRRALIFREEALTTYFDKGKDGIWRISRLEDRRGNKLVFERDAQANLLSIAAPEGLKLQFSYSGTLREMVELEGIDGSRKVVMRYRYDAEHRMILAESPYGECHEFSYDLEGRLVGVIRNGRYHAKFTHDDRGRRKRTESNNGARALFDYDDENRITTYLPGGDETRALRFHYNENLNIIREVNCFGNERQLIEDEEGFIAAEIDGEGNETRYSYDAFGHIKSITDASGRSTFYSWTPEGDLGLVIDNAGKSWELRYDDFGSLVLVKDPLGHIAEISNNKAGQSVGIIRHDGLIEQNVYDSHHWLVETMDYRSARTRFERDSFGRITRTTEANGAVTIYRYDDQSGHGFFTPAEVIRADGVATRLRTSRQGRVVQVADGEGRATVYEYDGLNNLVATTDPRGGRVEFRYDDESRLDRVVNEIGREWTFKRDGAGRIAEETDFDGRTTSYIFDKADRIVEARKSDGRTIAYEWDPSGRMLSRSAFPPGETKATQRETFDYDDVGRLQFARNANATIELEYDAAGRVIAETTNDIRTENAYDCCGNRTERRIGDHVTAYQYDPMGALTTLSLVGGEALAITRDGLGRPIRRQTPGGFLLELDHDQLGQLVRQTVSTHAQSASSRRSLVPDVWSRHYGWDRAWSPNAVSDPLWGGSRYDSDENGQIVVASHGLPEGGPPLLPAPLRGIIPGLAGDGHEVERFDYAPTHDIAASETALPQDPLGRPLQGWKTSVGGRVLEAYGARGERIRYDYDAAGRVVARHIERNGFRRKSFEFTWDGFDQLVEVKCPDGAVWVYCYDPFGRRIEKRQTQAGSRSAGHGVGSRFLWDGNVVAAEFPISAGQSSQSAIWWHFEPESFVPLIREDAASGQLLHVISDHIGTPRDMVDTAGNLVWSASYRLWGDFRGIWTPAANDNTPMAENRPGWHAVRISYDGNSTNGLSAISWDSEPADPDADFSAMSAHAARVLCPIRFQGQWEDPETGLYYNRFRTYDPLGAQYLSPDPIGIEGGLRQNGYVNVPVHWVDPLGLNGRYPAWMPAVPGFERHHIIPWHLQSDPFLRSLGFDPNGPQNMMYLPRQACSVASGGTVGQRGSAQHRGFNGHEEYNRYMADQIRDLERRTNNMNRRCKIRELRRFQLAHRTMLGTGAMQIANCR